MIRQCISAYLILLLFVAILSFYCEALSSSSSVETTFPTVGLKSTSSSQLAILDGAEWSTTELFLQKEGKLSRQSSTKSGYMTIVTGRRIEDDKRVIAMKKKNMNNDDDDDDNNNNESSLVYVDSIALIPDSVSDSDAIFTYITSLSSIHCALPRISGIGGGEESSASLISGKAVVLGSNELACFAAEGLASFGIQVSLVSPGSPKVRTKFGKVDILKPGVGSDDIGFTSHIGEFDSMVDTIGNELRSKELLYDDDDSSFSFGSSSTLGLLKARHNCQMYISTVTECQTIVAKEGIFGGPGKADAYCKRAVDGQGMDRASAIPPPSNIGGSVEALLEKGILFTQQQREKVCNKQSNMVLRGWSLADFWEETRWPRDSAGASTIRFGLPVLEPLEESEEEEPLVPNRPSVKMYAGRSFTSLVNDEDVMDAPTPVQNNPHVYEIAGVSGMQTEIIEPGKDCILFLSARFCKTCKSLNPKYTRMARIEKENDSPILFAKTEVGSSWGKQLGRKLEVDAVPAFVLFRNGKRFGSALSVSKLPSKKISRALDLLASGDAWDPSILKEGEGE